MPVRQHASSSNGTMEKKETGIARLGIQIQEEWIEEYLEELQGKDRTRETLVSYRRNLNVFYQSLPEEKWVGPDTLSEWRQVLQKENYKPRSINACISVVNGFLEFIHAEECQLTKPLKLPRNEVQPELSRREYLRLLSTAQRLGKERIYFIVKVFACIGLPTEELSCLTVESVREGKVTIEANGVKRTSDIPAVLQGELLDYILRVGVLSGPVFVTRSGKSLDRSAVTLSIQSLAQEAGIERRKCNPRCLRKLYQSTRNEIESNIAPLIKAAYERLLDAEQTFIGWENGYCSSPEESLDKPPAG